MNSIDFVMIWVDGSDPEWKIEKAKYSIDSESKTDSRDERYRDWDNLKYWFRGVEQFAPWVNNIYFITCGHVPEWLNLNASRLIHVKHKDYMKPEYLPTFSANPIELNLCYIKGLSEKFVFFNDDMFLCQPLTPEHFFRGGLPVHQARLHAIKPLFDGVMPYLHLNDMITINKNFDSKKSIKANQKKWFSFSDNGISTVIENVFNSRYKFFPGFDNEHLPVPILKKTMFEVWEKEYQLLNETSMHKFRDMRDVNQYIFRYWQLASGNFEPEMAKKLGRRFTLSKDNCHIYQAIRKQQYPMICINDAPVFSDYELFEKVKRDINVSFETILPEKSSFEL